MEEKTEGLLLQSISYLGTQKILKVFAPDAGLISLMSKKASSAALTNPFILAEWVYKKGKEEIHLLKDATLLNDFSDLRQNYETLSAAGHIAQDLLRSQLPAKKGGDLYALALAYLKKLAAFSHPEILAASFRLKLLLHEGLLSLQKECIQCGAPATHLSQGESFCRHHAIHSQLAFTSEEWEFLQIFTYARQFSLLQTLSLSSALQKKIGDLFEERLKG